MKDKTNSIKSGLYALKATGVCEAIGDGISIQDTDFMVLYQNQAHKNIIGEHIGEYCYKAYEKKEDVCEGCPVAMSFKDGKIHTTERSASTDKGTIHVEITSSPLMDSTGEIVAGVEVVRDITERKWMQRYIKESEEKYRLIFEKAPVGILHFKKNGDVTNCNDKFAEIIGAPKYSVIDFNLFKRLKDTQMKNAVEKTLAGGMGHYEGEYLSVLGGKHTYIKAVFTPTLSTKGSVSGGIGIFEDITERKKMDKEVKERIEELEHVYNMTLNRELKMKKQKEEIEKLKSELSKYKQ
jgi:PAS domain S-box-containing protein